MNILESILLGKDKNQDICEDGAFVNDNFVAVIDGVTSKGKQLWSNNKKTSGRYAKDLIIEELGKVPYNITAEKLITRLNSILYAKYKEEVIIDNISEWLRASIVVYSNYYKEIWSYGDCKFMINDIEYKNTKKVDEIIANTRSLILEDMIINGSNIEELIENDVGRKEIMPLLKRQFNFENKKSNYGYPILNGHNYNYELLKKIKVYKGDNIVLASDGYPKLFNSLDKSEKYLQKILIEDPLCFRIYKSTKGINKNKQSFDDRCYYRFICE